MGGRFLQQYSAVKMSPQLLQAKNTTELDQSNLHLGLAGIILKIVQVVIPIFRYGRSGVITIRALLEGRLLTQLVITFTTKLTQTLGDTVLDTTTSIL